MGRQRCCSLPSWLYSICVFWWKNYFLLRVYIIIRMVLFVLTYLNILYFLAMSNKVSNVTLTSETSDIKQPYQWIEQCLFAQCSITVFFSCWKTNMFWNYVSKLFWGSSLVYEKPAFCDLYRTFWSRRKKTGLETQLQQPYKALHWYYVLSYRYQKESRMSVFNLIMPLHKTRSHSSTYHNLHGSSTMSCGNSDHNGVNNLCCFFTRNLQIFMER